MEEVGIIMNMVDNLLLANTASGPHPFHPQLVKVSVMYERLHKIQLIYDISKYLVIRML